MRIWNSGSMPFRAAVIGVVAGGFLLGCGNGGPGPETENLASFELTATSPCTSGEAFSLTVSAVGDQGNKPFSDFHGSVSLSASSGTITPSSVALTNGRGTATVTLDQSGQVSLTASAQGKTGTISMEVLPEEVLASFELTTSASPEIGVAFSLQVTAVGDRGMKPLGSFEGMVTLASSKGTITPASVNLVGGTANVSVTLDQDGEQTVTAASEGKSGTLALTVLPEEALGSFQLSTDDVAMKGVAFTLQVKAVGDRGMTPFEPFNGVVDLAASSGTIAPATVALADGAGSTTVTLDEAGNLTLTASAEGKTGSLALEVAPEVAGEILATSDRGGGWDLWKIVPGAGDPVRLTNHSAQGEQGAKAWSPDGTRIAYMSKHTGDNEIWVVNADGTGAANLTNRPSGGDANPSWSPDGAKIAFQVGQDGQQTISVMNPDGSGLTQLTQNGDDKSPEWSPDGTKIVWVRDDGVYVMNADGTGQTLLAAGGWDPEWSPDGARVAYVFEDHLYVVGADGTNPTQLTSHPDRWDGSLKWSPDGTQIAFLGFTMSDGFRREIYLINADGTGLTQLTNLPGQPGNWPRDPVWSPDGEWICGWSWNDGLGVVHPASGTTFGITLAGAKYWYPAWRPGG